MTHPLIGFQATITSDQIPAHKPWRWTNDLSNTHLAHAFIAAVTSLKSSSSGCTLPDLDLCAICLIVHVTHASAHSLSDIFSLALNDTMQPANSQEADIELTRSMSIPILDPEASPLLLSRAPSTLEQHLSSISRVPSTQQLLRQSSPLDSANEQLLRKASSIIDISNDQLSRRSSVIDFTTEQLSRKSSVINIANEPAALQPASSWNSMCAAAAEAAKLPPPPLRLSNSETCIESHTSVPSTPVAAIDLSQTVEAAAPGELCILQVVS